MRSADKKHRISLPSPTSLHVTRRYIRWCKWKCHNLQSYRIETRQNIYRSWKSIFRSRCCTRHCPPPERQSDREAVAMPSLNTQMHGNCANVSRTSGTCQATWWSLMELTLIDVPRRREQQQQACAQLRHLHASHQRDSQSHIACSIGIAFNRLAPT
jgi:hypothetical protein